MATIEERLMQVTPKLDRAKKHLDDLNIEIINFLSLKPSPYGVSYKRNPETRQLVYYLSHVSEVRETVALITGDVIQNLMSALDHLAWQLVCASTDDNPPNKKWVFFPIQDTAEQYDEKKAGKIPGARPSALKVLDKINPYKGGDDLLWTLFRLNNIDKHRLLVTVGSMFQSMDIGGHLTGMMQKAFSDQDIPILSAFFKPADVLFPLKAGDELFIDGPDAEPNEHAKFRFGVALSEPGIVEAKSLMDLMISLYSRVTAVINELAPELYQNP